MVSIVSSFIKKNKSEPGIGPSIFASLLFTVIHDYTGETLEKESDI